MATFLLRARVRFEAAHHLDSYHGVAEPSHGHSWQVEASVRSGELDNEGLGFDFLEIKQALASLASLFDHRDINTVPPFDQTSPTTENLAVWFYERLRERLPAAQLEEVTVWEGPDCSATYRP